MRHLISTADLSRAEAIALLDDADKIATSGYGTSQRVSTLSGKRVANLFFEDSTRTRLSFELAAKQVSADVLSFSARGSSVSKGESLKDTILTLGQMGIDAIVMRHSSSGAAHRVATSGWLDVPVINAGDGTHEHPTQALLDALTIRQRMFGAASTGKGLDGAHVVIVGDIRHSRVARSNVWLLTTLGARVTLVGPSTLIPPGSSLWPVRVTARFDDALEDSPTVVMMLRMQRERMTGTYVPSTDEYTQLWGLTPSRFQRLDENVVIMHPGPMNRGLEICSEAADSARSAILAQVSNGVAVRMAALLTLLAHTTEVAS